MDKTPPGPAGVKLAQIPLDSSSKKPTLEQETSNIPPLGGELPHLS